MNNRFYMMCLHETVGDNASFHCRYGNEHGEMAMKQGKRLSKYIVMSGVGE